MKKLIAAILLMFVATTVFAAREDVPYLAAQAKKEGLVRVLVVLDVDTTVEDLRTGAKKAQIASRKQQVLAGLLVSDYVAETLHDNGLGQLSVVVTEAGFARLAKLPGVRDVQHDMADGQRTGVFDYGQLARIRESLTAGKTTPVRIYYTDGRLVERPITLREFFVLKDAKDVRAIAETGVAPRATQVDPAILDEAAKGGDVNLVVEIAAPEHFSPMQSKLSDADWQAQMEYFNAVATRFAAKHGVETSVTRAPGFGVRVTAAKAREIVAHAADETIRSIRVAMTFRPQIGQSLPYVYPYVQQMWASGQEAVGQHIAVIDTGVETSHPFLAGRVGPEGCYKNPAYGVQCPNADANGDSPWPTPGSGAPNYSVPYELAPWHGTHVAGIAAGRNGVTRGVTAHGVARAANISAINIFTYDAAGSTFLTYEADINKALELYAFGLPPGNSWMTINLSIGGAVRASDCSGEFYWIAWLVNTLRDKNVAVVIAGGNSNFDGFSYPACAGSSIKVVAMDTVVAPGMPVIVTYVPYINYWGWGSNHGDAALFSGPVFAAPGHQICSSITGGGMSCANGTSMAAPHVAGLYAAVKPYGSPLLSDWTMHFQATAINLTHPGYPGRIWKQLSMR